MTGTRQDAETTGAAEVDLTRGEWTQGKCEFCGALPQNEALYKTEWAASGKRPVLCGPCITEARHFSQRLVVLGRAS